MHGVQRRCGDGWSGKGEGDLLGLGTARGTIDEVRMRERHTGTRNVRFRTTRGARVVRSYVKLATRSREQFHSSLRQLGVRLQGNDMMNETSITTTAAREHFLRMGGEPNHALEVLGLDLLPNLLPDETLSETPSYEEFW